MNEPEIDQSIQMLLQFAGEQNLTHTIWALSPEQKKSHLYKQLGEQRYLSALRSGGIDNAEMTKQAFAMDPYFLKSRIVTEAAIAGFNNAIDLKHYKNAKMIKEIMGLPDEFIVPDGDGVELPSVAENMKAEDAPPAS